MGGTACHSSSYSADNGCTSLPDNSVLSVGAIVGIVIGSLLGIALIIFVGVLIYKLSRRNRSLPHQHYHPNIYNVPMNTDHHHHPRRPEMYIPSKSPEYFEAPMNNTYYENA
jgi:hypothetical protein